ncbi:hypothetical protein EXIGLDRAFT_578761, partial [Exidia glandulosa HHB12029]
YNGAADWDKFNEFHLMFLKYCREAYIDRKRQVGKLLTLLTDKAKRFYMNEVAGREQDWTRDRLFIELYNYCFPADFRSRQRKRFDTFEQRSLTVKDYLAKLRSIADSIGDITDAQFGTRFLSGMKPELAKRCEIEGLNGETHDVRVIADYAQRVESA